MAGESLVLKFVDLFVEASRQRPRKASLKSVVRLRRSLLECQDAFERFNEESSSDPESDRLYALHDRWSAATHALLMDMGDVGEELEILSPDVARSMSLYADREVSGVHHAVYELGVDRVEPALDIDLAWAPPEHSDETSFPELVEMVNEYLRSEFTADELRAVL
ncbi:MAG: hypothetical protein GY946_17700 [bacterium]|nr:hypothetical protein [bacterium]